MRRVALRRGAIALGAFLLAAVLLGPGGLLQRWAGGTYHALLPGVLVFAAAWAGAGLVDGPRGLRARMLARAGVAAAASVGVFLLAIQAGEALAQLSRSAALTEATAGLLADLGRVIERVVTWEASLALALVVAWAGVRRTRTAADTLPPRPATGPDRTALMSIEIAGHLILLLVAALALRTDGVLERTLDMDTSFLLPAALLALVAWAGVAVVEWTVGGSRPATWFIVARGAVVFAGALAAFARVPDMVHSLALSDVAFPGLRGVDSYVLGAWTPGHAVALAAVVSMPVWTRALEPLAERQWVRLTLRVVRASAALGGGMLLALAVRGEARAWPPASAVGDVVLWGAGAVAAGVLLGGLTALRHPLAASLGRWLEGPALRNLALGIGLGAYVAMVRPLLFRSLTYAGVLEWVVGVVAAWRLLRLAQQEVEVEAARRESGLAYREWRRHEQARFPLPDSTLDRLKGAVTAFVDYGLKEDLLVALVRAAGEEDAPSRRAVRAVHPLVEHRDAPVSAFTLPWERKRREAANRAAREAVVARCIHTLDLDLSGPANGRDKAEEARYR